MKHCDARERICVCCLQKTKRRARVVHLDKKKNYLTKVTQIFPDFDVQNFWFPKILCQICANWLLNNAATLGETSLPARFESGLKFIQSQKRRSTRESAINDHENCRVCAIANEATLGFIDAPVEEKAECIEAEKDSGVVLPQQGAVILDHEGLKRLQVENKLSQNQLLGVMKSLRYLSLGAIAPEPGLKEWLEGQNKIFQDIFEVCDFL